MVESELGGHSDPELEEYSLFLNFTQFFFNSTLLRPCHESYHGGNIIKEFFTIINSSNNKWIISITVIINHDCFTVLKTTILLKYCLNLMENLKVTLSA